MTEHDPINSAEVIGGIVVPAIIALAYGLYLVLAVDLQSTNGWILATLGGLSLIAAFTSRAVGAFVPPFLLGLYTFAVPGCLALGLAIAERSGARIIFTSIVWILFGWYTLNRANRVRRYAVVRSARSATEVGPLHHAPHGPPPRAGEDL